MEHCAEQLHNGTSILSPISMGITVASNVACRVLSMHPTGGKRWYTSNKVAYDLRGHQAYGKLILLTQSKLSLVVFVHDW